MTDVYHPLQTSSHSILKDDVGMKSIIKYIYSGNSSSSFHVYFDIFQCRLKGLDRGLCVFLFYCFGKILKFKLLCMDDSSKLTKVETTLGLLEPNWSRLSQTFKLESTTSEMLQKQECNCNVFNKKTACRGAGNVDTGVSPQAC